MIRPNPHGFGLWVEQLLAESTGKEGRGLVPAPDESPEGADRQAREVELDEPYDLGSEFFRWEFATAVAGAILEINPFDQPNVQEAKDRTVRSFPARPGTVPGPEGTVEGLFAQARPGDYVAIQAFVDPAEEERLQPFVEGIGRRRAASSPSASGRGTCTRPGSCTRAARRSAASSRSSTTRAPSCRSRQKFGFGRLINAQAEGDYAALKERGRPVARIRMEDIEL